jgi:hypothetical protein
MLKKTYDLKAKNYCFFRLKKHIKMVFRQKETFLNSFIFESNYVILIFEFFNKNFLFETITILS